MASPSLSPASAASEPSALAVRGVRKAYGSRSALDDVSFSVASGERVALLGPNGAGKTTLLQIAAGLLTPDAGEVSRPPSEIGWVPQRPALYGKLSVRENLDLFARLSRVPDPAGSVAAMLEQTSLGDRADDEVARLSGGNRQRVNVAIGLLGDPAVLLLDEPAAALDPVQRGVLWEVLDAAAARGVGVVCSTHDGADAERRADRLLVLASGTLRLDGTPAELRAAAGHPDGPLDDALVTFLRAEPASGVA